jgi:hypothetical protein
VRIAALIACALGACYSPAPVTGLPCDPAIGNCPRGQTCVATASGGVCDGASDSPDAPAGGDGAIDVAIDGPSGPDGDGDGVADATDNCVMKANANQANEDGDAWGDVCDPCPPIADAATPDDPDADGVSGFCDIRPNMAGEHIVLFEGFRSGLPPTWMPFGTWTPMVNGTQYSVAATVADGQHATLRYPQPAGMYQAVTVSTGFAVTAVNSTMQYGGVGAIVQHAPGGDTAVLCAVATIPGQGARLALINTGTSAVINDAAYENAVGTSYATGVTWVRASNGYLCTAASAAGATATAAGTAALSPVQPEIGVRIQGGGARIGWVLVTISD